ncbi:MAG: hypothetical protein ACKVPX_04650 [Myxococcaceae bacterium]
MTSTAIFFGGMLAFAKVPAELREFLWDEPKFVDALLKRRGEVVFSLDDWPTELHGEVRRLIADFESMRPLPFSKAVVRITESAGQTAPPLPG